MKSNFFKHTLSIVSVIVVIGGIGCSDRQAATEEPINPWDRQAMSTYLYMGSPFIDSVFISRVDFSNFDNVYLIDRDKWTSADEFDATVDSIVAVGGAAFPLAKRDIYRYAVDEGHRAGANILLTLGNDAGYAACDSLRRAKYVKALMQAVDHYGFDGIDIDWEANLAPNLDKHTALMEDLRQSLDSLGAAKNRKYYLSTALTIAAQYPDESLRERMGKAVDWVNMMSYDSGGGVWGAKATHNTPVQVYADSIDNNWKNVPREKLHLGLASYGFQYHGLMPGEPVAEGKTTWDYGYYVNYSTVVPMIYNNASWRPEYDSVQKVYYFINDSEPGFITCDTPETLMHKYQLAVDKGLGGTFWWEYAKDIVPDANGGHKWSHSLIPAHKRKKNYKQ